MRIPLDYYRILGVPIQAIDTQLSQAYHDRALQHRPGPGRRGRRLGAAGLIAEILAGDWNPAESGHVRSE